jgi:hypothetical protein
MTSVAQVFDERGDGLIVQGGSASYDKDDRSPHLSREDAQELLAKGLATYQREHKTMPARLVMHKTSNFNVGRLRTGRGGREARGSRSRDGATIGGSRTARGRLSHGSRHGDIVRSKVRNRVLERHRAVFPGLSGCLHTPCARVCLRGRGDWRRGTRTRTCRVIEA